MGAFGDIGARGLLFDARQPACPTGLMGSSGLGSLGKSAFHNPSFYERPLCATERTRYRGRALAGRSGYYVYHHNYLSERT
jgi:hypothetical protein